MNPKTLISFLTVSVLCTALPLLESRAETESDTAGEPQTSSGIELPIMDPDYPEGHFETLLWPDGIVLEMEIEHLRFLATSPETPAEDRAVFMEVVRGLDLKARLNGPGF